MDAKSIATAITTVGKAVIDTVGDEKVQEMVLGKYSDGTVRSLPDAISGETLSSKSKEKYVKRGKKAAKKNTKIKL